MRDSRVYHEEQQNEAVFLASLLEAPELFDDCVVQSRHFLNDYNRHLFLWMQHQRQHGQPSDYFTLIQSGASVLEKVGGRGHVDEVKRSFLTLENFDFQQERLLHFHATEEARGRVQDFLDRSARQNKPEDIQDLIRALEDYETIGTTSQKRFKDRIFDRVEEHMASPAEGIAGVRTGYRHLDFFMDGWQRKKLHVIGARPSVGKTAFMLNSIMGAMKQDRVFPTVFSLETSDGDLIDRLIAAESRVDLRRIKNFNRYVAGDDDLYGRYIHTSNSLAAYDMDIREDQNTVNAMRGVLRKNKKDYPNHDHVVFVDYLTLMHEPGHPTKHLEVEAYTNKLKKMAKDFDVPVIVLAQLSRGVESRQDKRPVMSDLRESGAIEQAADFIGFLHREDYQQYDGTSDNENMSDIELIVAKNRDGKVGKLHFFFAKATQQFHEVVAP